MSDSPPTRRRTVDPSPSGATRIVRPATPADEIPLATSAYAPRRSPGLVTGTPAFAPVPVEEPPAGLGPVQIGWSADRTSLAATSRAAIRPLETSSDVLPELVEAPEKARPLWRHPASIVSMITTFVALLALGAFIVFGLLNPGAAASGLALEVGDDNVRATWSGPDTPYQLVVVGGPGGDELDISQLVTGTAAAKASRRPSPKTLLSSAVPPQVVLSVSIAVSSRMDLVAAMSPLSDGTADQISATVPATCGEAMDVPLIVTYPPLVQDERTFTPGRGDVRLDLAG